MKYFFRREDIYGCYYFWWNIGSKKELLQNMDKDKIVEFFMNFKG